MENQTNKNSNKKVLALIVALVVVALALVAVFAGRGQQGDVSEATATPEAVTTDAPTDEPEATEEPIATEEPAPTEDQSAAVTDEPETIEVNAGTNPEDVMVLVNGTAVTRADIEEYRTYLINYFGQQGYDMTDEGNLEVVSEYALNTAIENTVLDQKIIDLGLELTDEERAEAEVRNAAEWAELVDMYAQYYYGLTDDSTEEEAANARLNTLALLESMGYTESTMLESALDSQRFEKIYAYMVEGAEVTDDDIQAAFDAHVAEDQGLYGDDAAYYEFMTQVYGYQGYYTPAGYRGVTHILLEVDEELLSTWQALSAQLEEQQDEGELTDAEEPVEGEEDADAEPTAEPVTQEQVDAAYAAIIASVQPTIDEIYAKLEAGTPFADLVAEYGTDPGMTVEPNKTEGYPVHMDSMMWDPAFVAGAFSVDEVGAVAQPVVGSYGVHIIQYTRDIPAGAVELTEELRAAILDEVMSAKEGDLYRQTMNAWLEGSEIVYSDEAQTMRISTQETGE